MDREWCIRCEETYDVATNDDAVCLRAPDRGPHECFAWPEGVVRTGSSLHIGSCPRSNPSVLLPKRVPCMCRPLVVAHTEGEWPSRKKAT